MKITTKTSVAQLFDCAEKFIKDFEEKDNFNPENTLSGFMCIRDGQYYGSLIITKINGKHLPAPQKIFATPKQKYPFDKQGNWHFPPAIKINIYEKFDGTNILSYHYYNPWIKKEYITFKTRLCPIVRETKFGNFLNLWNEILGKYSEILDLIPKNPEYNFSFELYGSKNKHLILYDVPLDYVMLFAIDKETGEIVDPEEFNPHVLHLPKLYGTIEKQTDFVSFYKKLQAEIESGNEMIEEGQTIKGSEGGVWYIHTTNGDVIQMKMKPETIEAIHFAMGKGISKGAIITTIYNSLENTDNMSYEFIKQLLLEEFDDRMIEAHKDMILDCIEFVKQKVEFKEKVLAEYQKIGISFKWDKIEVMRALSKSFSKTQMREVYGIVSAL